MTAAEKGASFMYRNLLLFPKATSQLAKTVFSIPTHLRNIISAGAFAAANGILFQGFRNPKMLGDAFRKGWQISGVGNSKSLRSILDPKFSFYIFYKFFPVLVELVGVFAFLIFSYVLYHLKSFFIIFFDVCHRLKMFFH